jgi:Flp pilus assembly protein TadD
VTRSRVRVESLAPGAILVALTLGVYAQTLDFGFVNIDDPLYVSDNPHVLAGASFESTGWAFTTWYEGGWRPLVWLSFMLDSAVGGPGAGASVYHATNVLLHLANTLLVFGLLRTLTGALWQSAVVAALFAVHPQHVEAVAWVTSRKDVLSTLFWLLTTLAYVSYVRAPSSARYGVMCLCFALGLMAKPMLVALPFTLLLLDAWPLRRATRSAAPRLLLEKLPLLGLAAACGVITLIAQQQSKALASLEAVPMTTRLANAVVSTVDYMRDMVWPADLMAIYPHPADGLAGAPVGLSLLFLFACQTLVVRLAKRAPYLSIGWLWYLVTLLPVLGLVQFGAHARADRFTYVPSIGLFLAATWGVHALLERFAGKRASKLGAALSIAIIAALSLRAHDQAATWKDSETLHWHALAIDPKHPDAHHGLGMALANAGDLEGALPHLEESIRIEPRHADSQGDLAVVLTLAGRPRDATPHFRASLRLDPSNSVVRHSFATTLAQLGDRNDAIAQLTEIIRLDPTHATAHNDLGTLHAMQGDLATAIPHFREALRLAPNDARAAQNLETALRAREAPPR